MENKVYKFGYEDTDKKIEIDLYGLIFEIKNLDENKVEEFKNIDKNDKNVIETQIENILGEGCIEEINKKREKDGYSKLTIDIELNILGCIFEAYYNAVIGNFADKIKNTTDNTQKQVQELTMNNFNREQRRNYNRNYRNNYYRGNRRRY